MQNKKSKYYSYKQTNQLAGNWLISPCMMLLCCMSKVGKKKKYNI